MIIASQKENIFKTVCSEKDKFILNFKQYLINNEKSDQKHLHIAFFKKENRFIFEFKNKKSIFYKKNYFYPVTIDISQFDFKNDIEFDILYDKYVASIKRIENKMLLNIKSNYLNFKQGVIPFSDLNDLGITDLRGDLLEKNSYRTKKAEKVIIDSEFLSYLYDKNSLYKIWENYLLDEESLMTVFNFAFNSNINFSDQQKMNLFQRGLQFIHLSENKKVKQYLSDDYVNQLFEILKGDLSNIKKAINTTFFKHKSNLKSQEYAWLNFRYILKSIEEKYHIISKIDDLIDINPKIVITNSKLVSSNLLKAQSNIYTSNGFNSTQEQIVTAFGVLQADGHTANYLKLNKPTEAIVYFDFLLGKSQIEYIKNGHQEILDNFINKIIAYYETKKITKVIISKPDYFSLNKLISKKVDSKFSKIIEFDNIDIMNNKDIVNNNFIFLTD